MIVCSRLAFVVEHQAKVAVDHEQQCRRYQSDAAAPFDILMMIWKQLAGDDCSYYLPYLLYRDFPLSASV